MLNGSGANWAFAICSKVRSGRAENECALPPNWSKPKRGRIFGLTVSTARLRMYLNCRTALLPASPGLSSQACRRPRQLVQPPTSDLTAYDLYLRAYATYFAGGKFHPEALRFAEQAITHDPHYGVALSWAAICCFRLIVDERTGDPVAHRRKGADFARRLNNGHSS